VGNNEWEQFCAGRENVFLLRFSLKEASIRAITRGRVKLEEAIHTDVLKSYDGIVRVDQKKHYRVRHDRDEFAQSSHTSRASRFVGVAKTRSVKFRGTSRSTFYLHLKKCEFRLNHREKDLYALLFKVTEVVITI
jgi:transposase